MSVRSGWWVTLLLAAGLAGPVQAGEMRSQPSFDLAVEGELVSLHVVEGPLVEIVEELGRRLGFEVIAQSSDAPQITADFDGLPARDAVRRICKSIGYVEVPDPATGKIMRVVLTPTRSRGANRLAARREPLPARPTPPIEAPQPEAPPEPVVGEVQPSPDAPTDPSDEGPDTEGP